LLVHCIVSSFASRELLFELLLVAKAIQFFLNQ
jgi:hypothetical protein